MKKLAIVQMLIEQRANDLSATYRQRMSSLLSDAMVRQSAEQKEKQTGFC